MKNECKVGAGVYVIASTKCAPDRTVFSSNNSFCSEMTYSLTQICKTTSIFHVAHTRKRIFHNVCKTMRIKIIMVVNSSLIVFGTSDEK